MHVTKDRISDIPPVLYLDESPVTPVQGLYPSELWLRRAGVQVERIDMKAPHGFMLFEPFQKIALDHLERFLRKYL